MWTGDGKVFFFNPASKSSIWERPKELENNLQIDEMLREGPEQKEGEKVEPVADNSMIVIYNKFRITDFKIFFKIIF